MLLDETTFHHARNLDPAAIESLLGSISPLVHRMAHGLTGRPDVGDGIVHFVIKQAIHHLPTWRDPDTAERWFYHHTVLISRRASQHQPTLKNETLLAPTDTDPQYLAFIRAFRTLPQQQRESFILHHAERLLTRTVAIAMDCSTHAAELHLKGAHSILEPLAGPSFPALKDRMIQAYQRLTPSEHLLRPSLRRQIKRSLLPRRIKRLIKLVILLTLLAALLYVAYHEGWLPTLPFTRPAANE